MFILNVFLRFGGLQSSQSQAASKSCDKTATSSTDKPTDSDSEEEDSKDEFDPFSSQEQTEATAGEVFSLVWLHDLPSMKFRANYR